MSVVSPRQERRDLQRREHEAMIAVVRKNWPRRHDSTGVRRMLRVAIRMLR